MMHVCAKMVMQLPWAHYLLCGRFMLFPSGLYVSRTWCDCAVITRVVPIPV